MFNLNWTLEILRGMGISNDNHFFKRKYKVNN